MGSICSEHASIASCRLQCTAQYWCGNTDGVQAYTGSPYAFQVLQALQRCKGSQLLDLYASPTPQECCWKPLLHDRDRAEKQHKPVGNLPELTSLCTSCFNGRTTRTSASCVPVNDRASAPV